MKKYFLILFSFSLIVFIVSLILPIDSILIRALSQHAALFFLSLFFLYEKNMSTTFKKLGIPGNTRYNLQYTIGGFALFMFVLIFMNLVIYGFFTGLQEDGQRVSQLVLDFPISLLLFAVLVAPVSEELFFRGFLTSRFGPIISSILFSIAHITYGSIVQVVGVLVLGLILAHIYLRTRSIVSPILIHMLYNALAIFVIRVDV